MLSRTLGVLVLVAGVAAAKPAKEVRRTIGNASFAIPAGWTVREGDASDHLTITKADSKRYCILAVFAPRATDPDPETEFAAEWNNVLKNVAAAPTSAVRKVGARSVREAGVAATVDGNATYASAHVMDLDHQIITVISYSTDAKALTWCRSDLDAVLSNVRVTAPASTATPTPTPTPAPTPASTDTTAAPAPAAGAVSIHLSDLVGKWGNNGASTLSYVDSSGNYSGTSTAFFGEWYTFKADGSYTFSFQGRANNHTIRETGAGKVTFSGDLLVFDGTRAGAHSTMKLRLLGFQAANDGTAVLTLLDEQYPANAGNIGLYKQAWIREPSKKK